MEPGLVLPILRWSVKIILSIEELEYMTIKKSENEDFPYDPQIALERKRRYILILVVIVCISAVIFVIKMIGHDAMQMPVDRSILSFPFALSASAAPNPNRGPPH